jgi:hypothetical protein
MTSLFVVGSSILRTFKMATVGVVNGGGGVGDDNGNRDTVAVSDRPKTFSAEYSAENYQPNIRPKRVFGKCYRKRKSLVYSNFSFHRQFFPEKVNF